MTSELVRICEAMRYIGSNTDEYARALQDHEARAQASAVRVRLELIYGSRNSNAALAVAAFEMAARACAQAAASLVECGRLARHYSAANCTGRAMAAVAIAAAGDSAPVRKLGVDGFENAPMSGPEFTGAVADLVPWQVLSHVGSFTFDPSRRPASMPDCYGQVLAAPDKDGRAQILLFGPPTHHVSLSTAHGHADYLVHAALHEVGHVVWDRLMDGALAQAWTIACQTSLSSGGSPTTPEAITPDGKWDVLEDFCESFAVFLRSPEALRAVDENKFYLMEALFVAVRRWSPT